MLPLLSPLLPFAPFQSLILGRTTSIRRDEKWYIVSPVSSAFTLMYLPSRMLKPETFFLALHAVARTLVMAWTIIPATCRWALSSMASLTMLWTVTFSSFVMFRKFIGRLRRRRTEPPRGPRRGRFLW